jgi:hypothetical protein
MYILPIVHKEGLEPSSHWFLKPAGFSNFRTCAYRTPTRIRTWTKDLEGPCAIRYTIEAYSSHGETRTLNKRFLRPPCIPIPAHDHIIGVVGLEPTRTSFIPAGDVSTNSTILPEFLYFELLCTPARIRTGTGIPAHCILSAACLAYSTTGALL